MQQARRRLLSLSLNATNAVVSHNNNNNNNNNNNGGSPRLACCRVTLSAAG
jgi:hypothetical protein